MLGEEWGSEGKEGQIVLRWVRQVIGEGGDFGISEMVVSETCWRIVGV